MTPEKLLSTIERHEIKPIEVWDRLPYSTKILYCERAIESEDWVNILPKRGVEAGLNEVAA